MRASAQRPPSTSVAPPHRFDIPLAEGVGRPLPVFVVDGLAHEVRLMVKTREASDATCAPPLPTAFATAGSAWTLPDTSAAALLERPDLLAAFVPEDNEAFDARMRASLKTEAGVATWDGVRAKRDGVLERLASQRRWMDEEQVASARKMLTDHLLGVTSLSAVLDD